MKKRLERTGIMLAYPAEERNMANLGEQFFAQPKLNGERCWVDWFHDTPVLVSSYGNEFKSVPHINDLVSAELFKGIKFDGELYVHGWPRERIHSAVSRTVNFSEDAKSIQFHIFDIKDETKSQASRLLQLAGLDCVMQATNGFLQLVPTNLCTQDLWMNYCAYYTNQGFEGGIFRHMYRCYEERRSQGLIKYKPTEKDEYLIVDLEEGEGWCAGMLGAFVVTGDDGTHFRVGTGPALTKDKRQKYWNDRQNIVGKMLLVKHEAIKTTNGIPVCTVAVEIVGY